MDNEEVKKHPKLSEEEIQKTIDYAETTYYNMTKGIWKRAVAYWILAQVIGFVLGIITVIVGKYGEIKISFPTFDIGIPPIELSAISIVMFQATVTVCGIILGFCAVCIFFMLELSERMIERCDERIRRSRNKKKKDYLVFEQTFIKGASYGFSKYANLYYEISLPLLIGNVLFFVFCWFSGLFLIPNILLNLNSVAIISSGMYPVVRSVFWFRSEETKKIL